MDIALIVLATIALVRIWNFEHIASRPRAWLTAKTGSRLFSCPACNGFWFGAIAVAGSAWLSNPVVLATYATLSVFALLRVWLAASEVLMPLMAAAHKVLALPSPPANQPQPQPARPASQQPAHPALQRQADIKRVGSFKRRIVLLTSFADFGPAYSLVPMVIDQALMLARNPEWLVQIWVVEGTGMCRAPRGLPANVEIRPIVPRIHWKEDAVDEAAAKQLADTIQRELIALGNATVITHDLLFVSSYLTFAKAINDIGQTRAFAWLHQVHSSPGERPSAEALRWRCTLPKGHKLISTNEADVPYLARYYATDPVNIVVVPGTRDISSLRGFQPLSNEIIHRCGLLDAAVVQVLPLSAPRATAKGAFEVIDVFAALHRRGLDTRLLFAEAHANDPGAAERMRALRAHATKLGLPPEVPVFSSEIWPGTAVSGLPSEVVSDLMLVSNLFVFPSRSEATSLALKEAALAGALIIANSSVESMEEIAPFALQVPFGGVRKPGEPVDYDALAGQIEGYLTNPVNLNKRHVLKTFSRASVATALAAAVESTPFMRPPG